jgi:hypothetical protein
MHGGRGMHAGFWWEGQKERKHQKNLDINGRISIKMDLRQTGWASMDWIHLAQGRGQ